MILIIFGNNCAVCQFCNIQFHSSGGGFQFIGDVEILYAGIAVHTQFDLRQLTLISLPQLNNFHPGAVYPQFCLGIYQSYSKFHTVAIQQFCLLRGCQVCQPGPAAAAQVVGSAHILQLVIAVCIGIVNSNLVVFAIIEDHGNLHREVALLQAAVFVLAGSMVLYSYRYFLITAGIGLHSSAIFLTCNDEITVLLIIQAPITLNSAKHIRLKAAGDVVNFLSSYEAIAIGIAAQQQRLTVDVQLLAVASIGCYGHGNGIANLVTAINSNRAACQLRNIQLHRGSGGNQCKGYFHILHTGVTVQAHTDLRSLARILCTKLHYLHPGSVYPQFCIGADQLDTEFHAVAIDQLLLLSSGQVCLPFPTGNAVIASHILELVITVIGIVDSDLVLLAVIENKGNLCREVALLQAAVFVQTGCVLFDLNRYASIVIGIGLYGCSVFLLQNDQAAVILVAQIPVSADDAENSTVCIGNCCLVIAVHSIHKSLHLFAALLAHTNHIGQGAIGNIQLFLTLLGRKHNGISILLGQDAGNLHAEHIVLFCGSIFLAICAEGHAFHTVSGKVVTHSHLAVHNQGCAIQSDTRKLTFHCQFRIFGRILCRIIHLIAGVGKVFCLNAEIGLCCCTVVEHILDHCFDVIGIIAFQNMVCIFPNGIADRGILCAVCDQLQGNFLRHLGCRHIHRNFVQSLGIGSSQLMGFGLIRNGNLYRRISSVFRNIHIEVCANLVS